MSDPDYALIENLQKPECFPHPVGNIEVIETHISWVVLTGLRVYKIKKPVDLGFVDFSTRAKREACCHEELRLNRRYAEELYLDVVPITGTAADPKIDGAGATIEYAVAMKQFSQEHLLSKLIRQQALTVELVNRLAVRIAEFHQQIAVADETMPWGKPDLIHKPVMDNFEVLTNLKQEQHLAQLDRLQEWTEHTYAQHREEFNTRKCDGMTRECHGDLHLGNLFVWSQDVVPFDAIEFNASLRWIDVLSEVAFLVMDLADRGRTDYAHRVLNVYLEQTCDYTGLVVLPYYLVYRALVRAKVDAIRLAQEDGHQENIQQLTQDFAGYLNLAEQYTQPQQAKLMITHGVSGSGKTTGTWERIEQTGAIRIRSDVVRKHLAKQNLLSSEGTESASLYSSAAIEQTYDTLHEFAQRLLANDFAVLVDATFLQRTYRDRFRALAEQMGVPFEILHFAAPKEVLLQRVSDRARQGEDVSDADKAVVLAQLENEEQLAADEQAYVREMSSRVEK